MEKRFNYQPDLPTSITCWSYTGMVFLFSMLLWLEITVFQVYTAIVFVIFLIAAILQITRRKIVLEDDGVAIKTVFSMNAKKISYDDILNVEVEKHGLAFTTKYQKLSVMMKRKQVEKLYETLENNKKVRV
ncbi:EbsA family protein [Ligilactobacillus ruminis]|uniref:EbsA family protein n=1 Tax=Ligilactobacillus ruminis TaxID=1623 RepID=UPI0010817ECD|nr:pore-forming protein [Ligilactobacillus ruminis]MSA22034.1 pore-forming protein [Ligilactobacillus ruminis]MSA24252.1 pore-forming protein [Ligilactobacillus ruminis]MSA34530.1 pore-forming protein [Ligilactobacillus ruminis]MSA40925.1 pore-forming protein [Ligilactobacillus ruminis]